MSTQIREGDVFPTNAGGTVIVLEYVNSLEVTVQHQDDHMHCAVVESGNLRNGKVKNPYTVGRYGVGYIGDGDYRSTANNKKTPAYRSWSSMLRRCYDPDWHISRPTYIGCSVADEWHNFQVYAEWYYDQPNNKAGFHLDKDLRIGGNKQYGPDTCSFVPYHINSLLIDCAASRGDLPQGVSRHGNGFRVHLAVNGKIIRLGTYATAEQAFTVYKATKEENVKLMAEEWKDWLHPEVYNYLMGWELDG